MTVATHLLALGLLAAPLAARAQAGTVRGTLLDASTGQPLPFAPVLLRHLPDSAVVADAQTTEAGAFALEHLQPGAYVLQASALGYRPGRRALSITEAAPLVQLGAWRLAPAATQLADVLVRGERPPVTTDLDKRVVNVSKDLTAVGGTATDVLQNVPSVSVDQTGAVSLRGNPGVTIYIDGKPTGAAGGGRGTSLDQIPASSIDRVEVITNPGARYDAEGGAGIINIILKKNQRDGLNGTAAAGVGTRDKYTTSLTLNYRRGRVNVFGSYDFRSDPRYTRATLDQTTTAAVPDPATGQPGAAPHTLQLHQDRAGQTGLLTHALRLGLDLNLPHDQTLTLAVQPRFSSATFAETLASRQLDQTLGQPVYAGSTDRQNATLGHTNTADFTLDYRRLWPAHPGRELSAGAVYTPLQADNALAGQVRYLLDGARASQQQTTSSHLDQAVAQLDYAQPLGAKGRLEAGAKSTGRRYDNRYAFASSYPAVSQQSVFRYQEYIQAAYASYANVRGRLHYQAGLRLEQTNTHGQEVLAQQEFRRSYLNLFPSAALSLDLPQDQQLRLSYARRVQRPDQASLNPFVDRADPLNYQAGNPALLPEYIDQLELGHQVQFAGGASLATTAFYSVESQTIKPFRAVLVDTLTGTQVTSTTRVNLGDEVNYGLELVGTLPLTTWWKLNGTASAFRRSIKGSYASTDVTTASFAYTARLNALFTPLKKLDVQLALNYRSPVVSSQGLRQTAFNVDLAAKYACLPQERGTITLRVSDVFNTLRQNYTAYGPTFSTVSENKRESRIGYLTFSYRFGRDGEAAKPRKGRDDESGE